MLYLPSTEVVLIYEDTDKIENIERSNGDADSMSCRLNDYRLLDMRRSIILYQYSIRYFFLLSFTIFYLIYMCQQVGAMVLKYNYTDSSFYFSHWQLKILFPWFLHNNIIYFNNAFGDYLGWSTDLQYNSVTWL